MPRRLNNWLESYLEFTADTEPPRIYHTWVGLSIIASCLQRKCWIDFGHLRTYPNMFVVLVGPPGRCRKTTAMDIGEYFIREVKVPLAADSTSREALIQDLAASLATKTTPDNKIITHCSMTIYHGELAVFLSQPDNDRLIKSLCAWYDCRIKVDHRTVSRGVEEATNVWVNLLGATTPELLRETMPMIAIGGGLVSRLLFVYADRKEKSIAYPMDIGGKAMKDKLLYDLESMVLMSGGFHYNKDVHDTYEEWYNKSDSNPPFEDVKFSGYCDRRANHLKKLMMIVSASKSDSMLVTLEDFEDALSILRTTESRMESVFSGMGSSDIAGLIKNVGNIIATKKKLPLSFLMRKFQADADVATMHRVLGSLQASKLCTVELGNAGERWITYLEEKP